MNQGQQKIKARLEARRTQKLPPRQHGSTQELPPVVAGQPKRATMVLDDWSPTGPDPRLYTYPPMRCQCPTEGYCAACRQWDQGRAGLSNQQRVGRPPNQQRPGQRRRPRKEQTGSPPTADGMGQAGAPHDAPRAPTPRRDGGRRPT
jgi:hypothetical protein